MKTCDEYQIALEQHRRGLLEPGDAAELEAHAMICAECSKYSAEIASLDRVLSDSAERAAAQIDWSKIEANIGQRAQKWRRRRWALPLMLVPLIPFTVYLLNRGWTEGAVMTILIFVMMFALQETWTRGARRALQTREALLAFYRSDLDYRIKTLSFGRYYMPPLALLELFSAFFGGKDLPHSMIYAGFGVMFLGLAVHAQFFSLPKLRRERAMLD